ncbi:PREDICTED: uncharacterized protein LOC109350548 [Lupinus angustifolius]|uniref:uncharacterized protein LOC109350548 n=1 Tax=Lupinus angustifolius TaxID=3871 RepID=UPI00092E3054|nr:PREDICTED: uncharacterized protein LOC109350548 [Lupinus angustifolius]
MTYGTHLYQDFAPLYSDASAYRRLIGRLIYLTNTRPNITFVVNQLAQFMATPTTTHHNAAIKVLRYLKGNPTLGLYFPSNSQIHIKAYSDSDWAFCPDTRRSVTGYYIYLGHSLIS